MRRITTKEAAAELKISPDGVLMAVKNGWIKGTTSSGTTGRGRRVYFDADEIEAFKQGGAPAAQAYREEQARKNIVARRPRRVKV